MPGPNPEPPPPFGPSPFLTEQEAPYQQALRAKLADLETKATRRRLDSNRPTALTLAVQTTAGLTFTQPPRDASDLQFLTANLAAVTLGVADRYLEWLNTTGDDTP